MEAVPALSLFSPIGWKVLEIPCFHPVVNGDWADDAENTDDNPEQSGSGKQDGGSSGQCQLKPRRAKCRSKVATIQKGMTLPNKAAKTCITWRKRS